MGCSVRRVVELVFSRPTRICDLTSRVSGDFFAVAICRRGPLTYHSIKGRSSFVHGKEGTKKVYVFAQHRPPFLGDGADSFVATAVACGRFVAVRNAREVGACFVSGAGD